jgi:capsular exopolysaccharide synthesis family protein
MSEAPTHSLSGSELPARSVFQVLERRKWIILLTILLALAGAVAYLLMATPVYEASSRIIVEQGGPRLTSNDTNVLAGTRNYLYTQAELIRSQDILRAVANTPGVSQMRTFEANPQSAGVVGYLKSNVATRVGRFDDIITISVRSPYPEEAEKLANLLVVAYQDYINTRKKSINQRLLELLQKEKVRVDQELEQARREKLEFQVANADLSVGNEQSNPIAARLGQLSTELTRAQLEARQAVSLFKAVEAIRNDPTQVKQLLDSTPFKGENAYLRQELRQLQQQTLAMGKQYLPGMPQYAAVEARIQQLDREMRAEDQRLFDAYARQLEQSMNQKLEYEKTIEGYLNEQEKLMLRLNTQQARYAVLSGRLARLESTADALDAQMKGFRLLEDAGALNITPLEEATRPGVPVSPNRMETLFKALALGGLLGFALAWLRDLMDRRIRSAEEVRQLLGLPILGMIPHIPGGRSGPSRGLHASAEPMSECSEAYRAIRTAIYFGVAANGAKTLLITSPTPGDGKTTLAANLAITMAQAGNRVLLVDADFRRPQQHRVFGVPSDRGLSDVLAGDVMLEQVMHATSVEGLSLLPCGTIPGNPSEILNSQAFADVLAGLGRKFDQVIIDSPPVLPVTDARILAASCDATLLALRAEKTGKTAATMSRDALQAVGARLAGVVLNDVPRRSGAYGYGGARYDGYAYSERVREKQPASTTVTSSGSTGPGR